MERNYAVIENGKVVNVIVANEEFVANFEAHCTPYEEMHLDDTKVARIGDDYVDGLFLTPRETTAVPESITIEASKL